MYVMKSLFLVIIMSLILAGTSFAEPFLTCDDPDPSENVTSYIVSMDGGTLVETPAPLHYDLGSLLSGAHAVDVQAKNIWGAGRSPADPFDFTKELPSMTEGVAISID